MSQLRRIIAVPHISLSCPQRVIVLAGFFFTANYLLWRLSTFNPQALLFSAILYGSEMFGFITLCLHGFMTWRLSVREPLEPHPEASVDVFIPTINEALPIIRRTALAALAMEGAHLTWILDDGHRTEVRALAEAIGCGYIARVDNADAKAGNLNHALQHTRGAFIALFDADHAPKRRFLKRTLGYFRDEKVAFVQTPQDFYNLDSYEHRGGVRQGRLWSEQALFYRVIQRGKDFWNAAFFCGSCAVIRRSALEAIGGFATGTVTEDIHTSLKLHKAGFRSVYHAESLAFGIAAAHIEAFLRQRLRWGQGAMQVWRREPILFSRRLSWPQKLCYLASIITYFDGWQKALLYFTPAVALITGWVPLHARLDAFARHFIPYLLFSLWASIELGRGYCRMLMVEQYNMMRFAAYAYATIGFFRRKLPFRVTNKQLPGLISHGVYLLPQCLILLISAAAIPIGTALFAWHRLSPFAYGINALWASVNLAIAAAVLTFTLKRLAFRRKDYRFRLPLAATLSIAGKEVTSAVNDISASGMGLSLTTPMPLETILRGLLHLPEESIPFEASVCGIQKNLPLSLGCKFLWESHRARERLELFLYGSDLERRIHRVKDTVLTPLEFLFRALPAGIDAQSQSVFYAPTSPEIRIVQEKQHKDVYSYAFEEAAHALP